MGSLLEIASANDNEILQVFLRSKGAVLPKKDEQEALQSFQPMTSEELSKVDGHYRNERDGERARLWARGSTLFFGDDLELASQLNQTGLREFTVSESPGIRVILNEEEGVGFTLRKEADPGGDSLVKKFARISDVSRPISRPIANEGSSRSGKWPRFRGPHGSGNADGLQIPLQFDGPIGERLAWKVDIPGVGHSSPVIWGSKIYLTTAVPVDAKPTYEHSTLSGFDTHEEGIEYRWLALCIDLNTGKTIWTRQLSEGAPVAKRHLMSSHANCTPAVNAECVVINLAGQGVYCLSHEGETLWKKNLGRLAAGGSWTPGMNGVSRVPP